MWHQKETLKGGTKRRHEKEDVRKETLKGDTKRKHWKDTLKGDTNMAQ